MHVELRKRAQRCRLSCVRADGSRTSADTGPRPPYHDLAHFVIERRYRLRRGFFGQIAAGRTLDELADPDVIRTLGPESLVAEVLAGALGSVMTGACRAEQFPELVREGLAQHDLEGPAVDADDVLAMRAELGGLIRRYRSLGEGESLKLKFD